ncbi:MAG: Radical SAM domain protein [Candidatus Uhrbacteria bacterium GW2011_GWF2_39_13]|uniref:Radical SAM domain protein n=1 Tax=Candidatus Uhrbacteria bacterium GW2011_GWF2_39_13 TaxID=1618995 RepID=A0A0G0MIX8_9BACT|nr:MAG: Radical SAM domain protein [Candidatus Uhrbacteria bacterium GW2011_GWF2_39_13]
MKIVLISNPVSRRQRPDYPPPGIAYLGAVAHQKGHEVLLLDGGLLSCSQIISKTRLFSPDILGVTCWTIDRGMVWKLCEMLKQTVPNAILIMGGPHATIYPEHIFKLTHTSAVVLGEGEDTFSDIIDAISEGKDFKSIPGLALRAKDNNVFYTEIRQRIDDLDRIPLPYYAGFENFSFSHYCSHPPLPSPSAAIISSRGCVFDCSYCASVRFWGSTWRFRSPENILAETGWLVEKYGVRSLFFYDDNFPVNKNRAIAICEGIIKNKWDLKWACCSHVKMINSELLKAMKASGCIAIDFGVESGDDNILMNINKCQNHKDIERAFSLTSEAGISAQAYLMVGNPGESESSVDNTIELIKRIKPRMCGTNILWLLPGTKVYQDAVRNGFINDDYWLTNNDVPYNLQEHSMRNLVMLRQRLMMGIAKEKNGISLRVNNYLKCLYYRHPFLSRYRSLVPNIFR